MRETALIALGFKQRQDDFGYSFSKCIGDIELITQSSEFVDYVDGWFVQFFDYGSITITSAEDLEQLIKILEKNLMKGDSRIEINSMQN